MKKPFIAVFAAIVISCVLIEYFYLFFQPGIVFDGQFLRRHESGIATIYQGKNVMPEIAVNNQNEIDYILKSGKIIQYTYQIQGDHIVIYSGENICFNGTYNENDKQASDENGTNYTDLRSNDGENIQMLHIIRTAMGKSEQLRGNLLYFCPAVGISLLLLLNILFPKVFWKILLPGRKDKVPPKKFKSVQNAVRIIVGAGILVLMMESLYM